MANVKVACAQFRPIFGDTWGNLKRMEQFAKDFDGELIVYPELATCGYEFKDVSEVNDLSISAESNEFHFMRSIAADSKKTIIIGYPERDGNQLFNSSVLFHHSEEPVIYRKVHLFDRETKLFSPGDKAYQVIATPYARIGMMICFDWVFPEAARQLALQGAQIICHPSNLVLTFCQRAMFARSVENSVFTMTCNRVGSEERTDRKLTYTGQSQILSNRGEMLAQASVEGEELISATIDPTLADNKRLTQLNDLFKDRRAVFYTDLCK